MYLRERRTVFQGVLNSSFSAIGKYLAAEFCAPLPLVLLQPRAAWKAGVSEEWQSHTIHRTNVLMGTRGKKSNNTMKNRENGGRRRVRGHQEFMQMGTKHKSEEREGGPAGQYFSRFFPIHPTSATSRNSNCDFAILGNWECKCGHLKGPAII